MVARCSAEFPSKDAGRRLSVAHQGPFYEAEERVVAMLGCDVCVPWTTHSAYVIRTATGTKGQHRRAVLESSAASVLRHMLLTDCMSLHGHLVAPSMGEISDKRSSINLASLRQGLWTQHCEGVDKLDPTELGDNIRCSDDFSDVGGLPGEGHGTRPSTSCS